MNRSATAIGIGVLAIAILVGVVLYLQLPSPDAPRDEARVPAATVSPPATATEGAAQPDTQTMRIAPAAPAETKAGIPTGPQFDVVRVDRQGNIVIAGKAEPDCEITVRDGDKIVGTAISDRRGDWVIVPGDPLAAGEVQLSLSSKCGDAPATEADRVIVLIVPKREAPAAGEAPRAVAGVAVPSSPEAGTTATASQPVASGATRPTPAETTGAGSGAYVVAIPRDVTKLGTVMQAPQTHSNGVNVGSIDYDDKGSVVIAGTAKPDSDVQVYLDNRLVGRVTTESSGKWQLAPETPIAPGQYTLRADQVQPDGNVAARVEIPFVRGEPLGDLPAGRIVVIQPGDYLWKIARASYGTGARYTLIYEANRAQIRDPDLIYPGQVFALPRVN